MSATERDNALGEIQSARHDAQATAEIIQGIPIYNSLFWTLERIARKLERAERLLKESHERG